MVANPFIPMLARIVRVVEETPDVKTFRLKLREGGGLDFTPGQFVTVTVFGVGEAPFAISSPPHEREYVEVSVRAVGNVTRALHRLTVGDVVGIRGPFGKGFPLDELRGRDLVFLAGGTGLLGVSSMLWYAWQHPEEFGRVVLMYGARTPRDFVRRYDLDEWASRVEVYLTVDRAEEGWRGHVGVVTTLLDEVDLPGRDAAFIVCGPPIMLKVTYKLLRDRGYSPSQIYVSLERHMKCGMGKCGRCMLSNGMYVCKDGPIFRCDEIPERDVE